MILLRQGLVMNESLRLFVMEGDPDSALLMRRHLERAGHAVTLCRSGADGLIVLGHTAFDLVLLSAHLPDRGGLDLLQSLAREGISVPVLIVSPDQDAETARSLLRAGAIDYIVKDTALTFLGELPKRIREAVKRHRLEQMNRLLIQALESARDGILITDLQGAILNVNHAVEEMTGYSRQELLGQTPRLLKSPVHGPEVFAQMWQTILARRSWQGELTNRRKDGSLFQVSLAVSPIVDGQGRMTHFAGILRDITERQKLERALLQAQKMQSVGTLAGGVAHEFNNLLAGINGYAALGVREPDVSPVLQEFLGQIVSLSERAAGLTRQLLAFARKPALTQQPTDMAELVRSTAELVGRTLCLEVVLDLPREEDALRALIVEADANQLQQALVNLALNARDARPAQPIIFRLRSVVLEREQAAFPQQVPPGDYVVAEVEDHGRGMTAEVLNQALDPFFTTKEVGQGTGLGLPMVFGIVQGHHGYLAIDSAPQSGTRVSLYLPRALPSETRSGPPPLLDGAGEAEPAKTPSRAILVIDDEQAVLDVVRRCLQIAGHEVVCASSGQDALEHLSNGLACDLIILDVMMPREDAPTTFQRLRQRRPGVPVLLCSGMSQAAPTLELLRNGAAGLLRKPFRMQELWEAVKQARAVKSASGGRLPLDSSLHQGANAPRSPKC